MADYAHAAHAFLKRQLTPVGEAITGLHLLADLIAHADLWPAPVARDRSTMMLRTFLRGLLHAYEEG